MFVCLFVFFLGGGGGDRGYGPRPGKSQSYMVPYRNTGQDPMENYKATKAAFNVGPPSTPLIKLSGSAYVL